MGHRTEEGENVKWPEGMVVLPPEVPGRLGEESLSKAVVETELEGAVNFQPEEEQREVMVVVVLEVTAVGVMSGAVMLMTVAGLLPKVAVIMVGTEVVQLGLLVERIEEEGLKN